MKPLKHHGKVFDAELTAAEKKAFEIIMRRYEAEWDKKNAKELDAMFLWELHERYGWGHTRLKRFYMGFHKALNKLVERYEMENTSEEKIWLCTYKLKEYGVDLDEWEKECNMSEVSDEKTD